jgi:hypothetical protein
MRNNRRFVGAFVMAATVAAFLAIASPASADEGRPGGPKRGTCGFLQGLLYRMPDGVADKLAVVFDSLFDCDI